MTITSERPLQLLVVLHEKIEVQKLCIANNNSSDSETKTNHNKKKNATENDDGTTAMQEEEAKTATKLALFALLFAISQAEKTTLTIADREQIDHSLIAICRCQDDGKKNSSHSHSPASSSCSSTVLKWPLLRALEHPQYYRAMLGLPQTMEQTRRWLTQAPPTKVREILQTCGTNIMQIGGNSTRKSTSSSGSSCNDDKNRHPDQHSTTLSKNNVETLMWVEEVLTFMTGDGRLKRELEGFVLKEKNSVRATVNKARARREELEKAWNTKKNAGEADGKKSRSVDGVTIDRDIRVLDQERQVQRAQDLSALIDKAVAEKSHSSKK